jgi:hypothetical protein
MAINLANNNSLANITALPASITGGAMTLLATQTASGSATLSFTSGIDSTYDSYVFKFYNIHAGTSSAHFQVNFRDGDTAYDATKTTTVFNTYHDEADNNDPVAYSASRDLAQSTAASDLAPDLGVDNDQATSGELFLYNPSSTTFVKHFISRASVGHVQPAAVDFFTAGYCNVTAAIDGVQFKMDSGNIDSGVIKLYGVS